MSHRALGQQFGPLFHGTTADAAEKIMQEGFQPGTDESRGAVWLTRSPEQAKTFAESHARRAGSAPAVLRVDDVQGVPSDYVSTRLARESGHDLSDYGHEVAVHRPSILRQVSRHS